MIPLNCLERAGASGKCSPIARSSSTSYEIRSLENFGGTFRGRASEPRETSMLTVSLPVIFESIARPVAGSQLPWFDIAREALVLSMLRLKTNDPLLKPRLPRTVSSPVRHSHMCPVSHVIAAVVQAPADNAPGPTPAELSRPLLCSRQKEL